MSGFVGAFPGAVNLPLLTDAERAAVGTRYKQCGSQAAIALGEAEGLDAHARSVAIRLNRR